MRNLRIHILFMAIGLMFSATSSKAQADTLKYMTGFTGSIFTVPEGKAWTVKRVTCAAGGYSLIVGSTKYDKTYMPGDKIAVPFYAPEIDLIGDGKADVYFRFEIIEHSITTPIKN